MSDGTVAVWAYPCMRCDGSGRIDYVACEAVQAFPTDRSLVQVKVGRAWHCARLDRSTRVEVEGLLLRLVIAAPAGACPECERR